MTPTELESNCYPMPDPVEKGKAIVKEDPFRYGETISKDKHPEIIYIEFKFISDLENLSPRTPVNETVIGASGFTVWIRPVIKWTRRSVSTIGEDSSKEGETGVSMNYYYPFAWH